MTGRSVPFQPARRARLTWFHALALIAGLQACADRPNLPVSDLESRTVNPILISRTQIAHTVNFSESGSEPDGAQVSGLFAFIATNGVGPKDSVLVEHGRDIIDQAHAETLAARLTSIGLRPAVVAAADIPTGIARVVVERYVAMPPDCPDWSQKPSPNYQNYNQRNFGCADASNLAAMVADPKDLAMGASMGAQMGDPVTKPVAEYRKGTPGGAGGGSAPAAAPPSGAAGAAAASNGAPAPSATGP